MDKFLIFPRKILQLTSFKVIKNLNHYTRDVAKELLTKDTQDQPTHFNEATFVEAVQSEYVWSSSPFPGSWHWVFCHLSNNQTIHDFFNLWSRTQCSAWICRHNLFSGEHKWLPAFRIRQGCNMVMIWIPQPLNAQTQTVTLIASRLHRISETEPDEPFLRAVQ